MRAGVLGTGMVGRAIAAKLAELGHEVSMGTRDVAASLARTEPDDRGNEPLPAWAAAHASIPLVPFAEAISGADIVVNATSGAASVEALDAGGPDALDGTIVIDVANPLGWGAHGAFLTIANTDSLGETIQRTFPGARVVKALNTVTAAVMVQPSLLGEETTIFIAGDDAGAKHEVTTLLTDGFGWRDVRDMGGIASARGLEAYLLLWIDGMQTFGTPMFNVKVVAS